MFDEFGIPRGAELDDAALPPLSHYVYCSRAASSVDDVEVGRIVESAQRNNLARGITGVLVYGSGVFFQWVEGPAAQIQKLIANLRSDPRHYDIVSLDQGEEERERLYPNWEMEKVEAEDIRAVLQDALESAEDKNNVAALKRILEHFASGPLDSIGRSRSGQ
ncbi:BLUF domain-containing protein [Bradyrhizobium sp. P5_C11_2]